MSSRCRLSDTSSLFREFYNKLRPRTLVELESGGRSRLEPICAATSGDGSQVGNGALSNHDAYLIHHCIHVLPEFRQVEFDDGDVVRQGQCVPSADVFYAIGRLAKLFCFPGPRMVSSAPFVFTHCRSEDSTSNSDICACSESLS